MTSASDSIEVISTTASSGASEKRIASAYTATNLRACATQKTCVLKFGSSVLHSEASLPDVVSEIYRWYRQGYRVIAVVSAMGDSTDKLLAQTHRFGAAPCRRATAVLLSTGELTSAALLSLALDQTGVPATILDHRQIGLRTSGELDDAVPCSVNVEAIAHAFTHTPIIVTPGFLGVDDDDCTTLLGRGGSDLTALFIAHAVDAARCRLIKDVDGLYESDPNQPGAAPLRFQRITFRDALRVDGAILQRKAAQFADRVGRPFEIGALHRKTHTRIGSVDTALQEPDKPAKPLRIALLGLGTVGAGVYDRLAQLPDLYDVVSIAVRDSRKPSRAHIPDHLLTEDARAAFTDVSNVDVVIELIGGEHPATTLIAAALKRGCHVITANKSIIARHGTHLHSIARDMGVTLRFSASVGGALPAIEAVQRIAQQRTIHSIEGVLNGSTNAVLDALAQGHSFDEAVQHATERGFCEADPTRDLNGQDAADKLSVLTRFAFGVTLASDAIPRCALHRDQIKRVQRFAASGWLTRQVARCMRNADGKIIASVALEPLPPDDPLAALRDEGNCLIVTCTDGSQHIVRGRGAGCIPTTESVLADLYALQRYIAHTAQPTQSNIAPLAPALTV